MAVSAGARGAAAEEDRALNLYNAHTHQTATIVFKRDGQYDQAGLAKLNYFLRDWRKNLTIKMDPHLFDLVWQVYRQTGATQPITVVCGYRSPDTNAMLRRRSSAVAQNSLHMRGQAMDFFIPGVDLATLRAVGMRMQAGGVGFYPTSGSPFVHMDTGSVRHWPRMSREQLVRVFPNGNTLHVPSDGKPLPGYAEALAAYKARQAAGIVGAPAGTGSPVLVAAADDIPTPRISPERTPELSPLGAASDGDEFAGPMDDTGQLLAYPPKPAQAMDTARFAELFTAAPDGSDSNPRTVAFDTAYQVPAPAAPADLRAAMAKRQHPARQVLAKASLPIPPTAVVATVDVGVDLSRSLRADAITTAVLRGNDDRLNQAVPPVLAYAASGDKLAEDGQTTGGITAFGVPLPQPSPQHHTPTAVAARPAAHAPVRERSATVVYSQLLPADLTLTKLDTQSLRLWIATPSTREKRYALLTMPDFSRIPTLLDKPNVAFAAHFDRGSARAPRTDHFDGAVIVTPAVVDLTNNQIIAAR